MAAMTRSEASGIVIHLNCISVKLNYVYAESNFSIKNI